MDRIFKVICKSLEKCPYHSTKDLSCCSNCKYGVYKELKLKHKDKKQTN